jgi:hypothetical protein
MISTKYFPFSTAPKPPEGGFNPVLEAPLWGWGFGLGFELNAAAIKATIARDKSCFFIALVCLGVEKIDSQK